VSNGGQYQSSIRMAHYIRFNKDLIINHKLRKIQINWRQAYWPHINEFKNISASTFILKIVSLRSIDALLALTWKPIECCTQTLRSIKRTLIQKQTSAHVYDKTKHPNSWETLIVHTKQQECSNHTWHSRSLTFGSSISRG